MPGPFHPGYITEQVDQIDSSAKYELGRLTFHKGRILQYVKHGAGAGRYNWVGLDPTATGADAMNSVLILQPNATHQPIGVAEYGGTASSYGWITRFGGATAKTAAAVNAAPGVGLVNAGAATGAVAAFTGATFLIGRSHGILVGSASASGTYVNVNCL